MTPAHESTLVLDWMVERASGQSQRSESRAVFFGLSEALALPPDAIVSPTATRPHVHTEPNPILAPGELAATLDANTVEVGRGRASAEALDVRLGGLVARASVYRVAHGSGASVTIGVVGPDPELGAQPRATAADLWRLATSSVAQLGLPSEHLVAFGEDGFLALYGQSTAQVAWLDGDRVRTVTVTCLSADKAWVIGAAQSVAELVADRVRQ